MSKRKVLWEQLRRTEFEQYLKKDAVVIIPVASIEQHGEHLPVNTDSHACFMIAKKAAEAINDFPVLVTPAIWTGYSPMHMAYPGSITLKFETLVRLLTDVAISIHNQGFKKIFFLNGHGGNDPIINAMRAILAAENELPTSIGYAWWQFPSVIQAMEAVCESDKDCIPRAGERDTSVAGHAGERETSLQLYLQPELVDMQAAVWVEGVWGDPSLASFEKGDKIFHAAVESIVKILRNYHSGQLEAGFARQGSIFKGSIKSGRK